MIAEISDECEEVVTVEWIFFFWLCNQWETN
jgi:hypothetical protein